MIEWKYDEPYTPAFRELISLLESQEKEMA